MDNKSSCLLLLALFSFGCERNQDKLTDLNKDDEARNGVDGGRKVSVSTARGGPRETSSVKALQLKISEADLEELQDIAYNIEAYLNQNPDEAAEVLLMVAQALAKFDRLEAITFLSHCNILHDSSRLAMRQIAQDWNREDRPGLEKALVKWINPDLGATQTATDLLGGLLAEQTELTMVSSWVEWIGGLPTKDLEGMALDVLLGQRAQMDEAAFDTLQQAYTQRINEPDFQFYLPHFGQALAQRKPEDVIAFLDQIPGGLYHSQTSLSIIAELARSHPGKAAEWLSADDVLETLFRPDAEAAANILALQDDETEEARYELDILRINREEKYDTALADYIRVVSRTFPKDAYQTIEAIHSPELAKELKAELEALDVSRNEEVAE